MQIHTLIQMFSGNVRLIAERLRRVEPTILLAGGYKAFYAHYPLIVGHTP